jgi:hypothetical protein
MKTAFSDIRVVVSDNNDFAGSWPLIRDGRMHNGSVKSLRRLSILTTLLLYPYSSSLIGLPFLPDTSDSRNSAIQGSSVSCFQGKVIHPGRVEIYLFDMQQASEVPQLLRRMQEADATSKPNIFQLYEKLLRQVKVSHSVQEIRSDASGRFSFRGLTQGVSVVVVGLTEVEDEPVFYAHSELSPLKPGVNVVTLDFSQGEKCER